MKYGQEKQHNAEFLQWLSPSYWLVESQLSSFRSQRSVGTLEWARAMQEFQAWRLSDLEQNSDRRITWIKGTLGIGKSIMAGYFIDLLKCLYPNAIVAYFFCRRSQPGLRNARDILRTLSYQCIENNNAARVILEKLKSKGFQITNDLCIEYLFEKLLLDPLRSTPEIYIVLDGLDEADLDIQDVNEKPELHVLLKCLAELPSTRFLCISRPEANISSVIPTVFSKTVTKEDNAKDIDAYVEKTVTESKTLQLQFRAAYKDPVEYFRSTGSGIFLWVVIVLKQLAKAQTSSVFQRYLKGFSAASGSMETLYSTILSRINIDYQECVREIIRWVVVAEIRLSVKTLQCLVEWCLEDKLVDFRHFLDENCGSILQFLPPEGKNNTDQDDIVRLVHETFRSFVVDPKTCPSAFVINEADSHAFVAVRCLKGLTDSIESEECEHYAARYWVNHLSKATSPQQSSKLLVLLHQFFVSEGIKSWVSELCAESHLFGLEISLESRPLRDISRWLREYLIPDETAVDEQDGPSAIELRDSQEWRSAVLREAESILGERIGKAAARIWLGERSQSFRLLYNCFALSLKYYGKRKNRIQTNLEELDELMATKFKGIYDWTGFDGSSFQIIPRNVGVAFFTLYKWDECIRYLQTEDSISDGKSFEFRRALSSCLQAKKDYDGVIGMLQNHPTDAVEVLQQAFSVKGESDKMIEILRDHLDKNPDSKNTLAQLYSAYAEKGDSYGIIQLSKSKNLPSSETKILLWPYLLSAGRTKGDFADVISICQEYVDQNPKDSSSWYWLGEFYEASGDHDRAIRVLELGLLECPESALYNSLATVYMAKGNYDEAIEVVKRVIERVPDGPFPSLLVEAYKKKENLAGLTAELQSVIEKYPARTHYLQLLGETYVEAGDYDNAVRVFNKAIERQDVPSPSLLHGLFTAYMKKGEHARAIKVFKTQVKIDNCDTGLWSKALFDIHMATQDFEGAVTSFEYIVNAADDAGYWGWPGLLKAGAAKGVFDAIFERFELAIHEGRMRPSISTTYIALDVYTARADYSICVQKLDKIVNMLPLESWTWHILAEAYEAERNYGKAIEVYCLALKHIPADYSFYKRLADLYLATSDYGQVLKCYEQAREIAQDSFELAYLQLRPRESSDDSRIPINNTFHTHFFWHSVCEAYKKVGDRTRAFELCTTSVGAYETAIDKPDTDFLWLRPGSGAVCNCGMILGFVDTTNLPVDALWSAAGAAYRAKGDTKGALTAFDKARALQPENTFLQNIVCELEKELDSACGEGSSDVAGTTNSVD